MAKTAAEITDPAPLPPADPVEVALVAVVTPPHGLIAWMLPDDATAAVADGSALRLASPLDLQLGLGAR